jgi:hypothetical protein
MQKGHILCLAILLAATVTSCKRRHDCYCKHTGAQNNTTFIEYRGYSRDEARIICKSHEHAKTAAVDINCELR